MKNFWLLMLLSSLFIGFAQKNELKGRWILDEVVYSDGEKLPVFARDFSDIRTLEFKDKVFKDNGVSLVYDINSNEIKTAHRNINYKLDSNYLILSEEGDSKVYHYLSEKEFLKKYPEFQPKQKILNGNTYQLANEVVQPGFNSNFSFQGYMSQFLPKSTNKTSPKFFKAFFVVDKQGKIGEVFIVNSVSESFDSQFKQLLKKAEINFVNDYNQDLLVSYTFGFDLANYDSKEAKKFEKLYEKAEKIYFSHEFDKALLAYQDVLKQDYSDEFVNRYATKFEDAKIRLAVCNYILDKPEKFCEILNEVGDVSKFKVRNYLLAICKN